MNTYSLREKLYSMSGMLLGFMAGVVLALIALFLDTYVLNGLGWVTVITVGVLGALYLLHRAVEELDAVNKEEISSAFDS